MKIEIAGFGEKQMSRRILRVSQYADNTLPIIEAIHRDFLEYEKELFNTEGKSARAGWKPLKPATIKAKAAAGLDPRILHATLTLRRSLTEESDENAVFRASNDGAFMGSSVPYGIYHQSTRPRTKLPRRPPIKLTEAVKIAWIKKVQRYLMTGEIL